MDLKDNIIEAVHFDVMRRVLEPVNDGIVDPGVNFEGCMEMVSDRIEHVVATMTEFEQKSYFYAKAKMAHQWCLATKAPDDLTNKVHVWLQSQVN